MPQPTRSMIHIDQPLTNISVAYIQNPNNFIADRVFPLVPVNKQSDKYFTYDMGNLYRNTAKRRARGTESAGSGWKMSTDSYFCDVWALHHDIAEQDRANADDGIDLDRDASEFLTQQMLIAREVDWANTFFATGNWTGSTSGSDITPASLWDTVAGTPIEDIRLQATSIAKKTGYRPNSLVLGIDAFDALCDHPDILDRIKYTQEGSVTEALLARLFKIDSVYVAEAIQNTAAENKTDSMSFIAGSNDALLCYVTPSPGLKIPTAGYTFVWRNLAGNAYGQGIDKFTMRELKSDRVEMEAAFDHKVIGANLGVFFSNVAS